MLLQGASLTQLIKSVLSLSVDSVLNLVLVMKFIQSGLQIV